MESVKRLQAGHGEWTDSMAPVWSFSLMMNGSLLVLTAQGILAATWLWDNTRDKDGCFLNHLAKGKDKTFHWHFRTFATFSVYFITILKTCVFALMLHSGVFILQISSGIKADLLYKICCTTTSNAIQRQLLRCVLKTHKYYSTIYIVIVIVKLWIVPVSPFCHFFISPSQPCPILKDCFLSKSAISTLFYVFSSGAWPSWKSAESICRWRPTSGVWRPDMDVQSGVPLSPARGGGRQPHDSREPQRIWK